MTKTKAPGVSWRANLFDWQRRISYVNSNLNELKPRYSDYP